MSYRCNLKKSYCGIFEINKVGKKLNRKLKIDILRFFLPFPSVAMIGVAKCSIQLLSVWVPLWDIGDIPF